ncbi:cell wall / vacuolar inhibitor of fructosidase 2 [Beta vulgaris subsp. vulgaris]|uniref:cell wall / vacuolar inhibitor of fructosidase 2 n=1 Tax=Beta vulgaris subsp. vulgaris TaxID=3555 RepID=UPI0020371C8D|nr:cell wall / vacuolar inhibitor of fructosidase 2 [Beta vulgaris subsp. vulgaris]
MNSLPLKISSTFCILITLFISIKCSSSLARQEEQDLVTKVCKQTHYFDLCMSILYPDSRKYTTDTKGLAKIVMQKDLTVSKEILDAVLSLAHDKGKSRYVREKCSKCYDNYKTIVVTLLPYATKSLDFGKKDDAIRVLKYTAYYAKACDDEFLKKGMKRPFENMSVHDMSILVADIVKLIT